MTAERPLAEFRARAVAKAVAQPTTQEVALRLTGEPSAETSDLALVLPAGAVAALFQEAECGLARLSAPRRVSFRDFGYVDFNSDRDAPVDVLLEVVEPDTVAASET